MLYQILHTDAVGKLIWNSSICAEATPLIHPFRINEDCMPSSLQTLSLCHPASSRIRRRDYNVGTISKERS